MYACRPGPALDALPSHTTGITSLVQYRNMISVSCLVKVVSSRGHMTNGIASFCTSTRDRTRYRGLGPITKLNQLIMVQSRRNTNVVRSYP